MFLRALSHGTPLFSERSRELENQKLVNVTLRCPLPVAFKGLLMKKNISLIVERTGWIRKDLEQLLDQPVGVVHRQIVPPPRVHPNRNFPKFSELYRIC